MQRNEILLSGGSVPWLGLKQTIHLAKSVGFDGIELVPTRKIAAEITHILQAELKYVKGLHHSWRLDMGHDREYGLPFFATPFFLIVRLLFFPKIMHSRESLGLLSKQLDIPATVHGLSDEWIHDKERREFAGGIQYELIGEYAENPDKIKKWLKKKSHSIVVDTRDDQSLAWAKNHGFNNWIDLWTWIELEKIRNIQLTLIGPKGLTRILNKLSSLPEKQFLWLHAQNWKGTVTVEVNPFILFLLYKANIKRGLKEIVLFVRTTLQKGKRWS